MDDNHSTMARELALVASRFQEQRTGRTPKSVAVVLLDDTLVVTFHDALTPAEIALAKSPAGAAQVQEFHRQLFASSNDGLRKEIARITGRSVREAASEIELSSGTVVHAFTSGEMVQLFLLAPAIPPETSTASSTRERLEVAENEGLHMVRTPET